MPLKPVIDFWSVLIFLGVIQGFFLAFNCFAITRRNQLTHALLGWLLVSVCLTVVEVLLCYSNYIGYAPFLVEASEPFNFVFPPLLYFYTLSLAKPDFQWRPRYYWTFLPAGLLTFYMLPFFAQHNDWLLQTVAVAYRKPYQTDALFQNYAWASTYTRFYGVFKYLLIGYQIGYLLMTLRLIHYYKARTQVATWSTASLRWVAQISWAFLAVFIIYALLTGYFQSDVGDVYVAACVSLVCFGMSFRLITQSRLLDPQPTTADLPNSPRPKYEKTALDETTARQILRRLFHHIEAEKPYLQPDLSVATLAAQLTTPPHQLSQVINQYTGQNFFDFINAYRVREIQQKLADPQFDHLKIEAIGLESGFNSKSAFNAAFKKVTQQTPSQYRKASTPAQH